MADTLPQTIKLPLRLLRTPSGYRVADATGRSLCFCYVGRPHLQPHLLTDDEALAVTEAIARALSA